LIRHDYEKGHFTKLVFKAYELEYLKLKRPNHLRAIFLSSEDWKGSFIAP
jgi:pyridoxamine 5'-phosphate oxidase